jgi:hypothetical protein
METTIVTLTDSFQLVGTAGAWKVIQVLNQNGADIYIGDTPTGNGFTLDKLDGMTPTGWVDANIYAKRRTGDSDKVIKVATAA